MPRFKLLIEYAGTRYSGWQVQKNARTVQGELMRAVRDATGQPPIELYGAGRTDAGVHALGQVAHLDPDGPAAREPSSHDQRRAARRHQRPERREGAAPLSRAARCRSRAYVYQIARRRTAFGKPFVWWVKDPLDIAAMRAGATGLTGRRDFRGFTDDDPEEKSTIVEIGAVTIDEDGDAVIISVEGSHFLWKLVRRMVGVLVEVGKGALAPADVARLLDEPKGLPATLTAPPSGLFLARVTYPGNPRGPIPRPPVALPAPRPSARRP